MGQRSKPLIMTADDDDEIRHILTRALGRLDADVIEAEDGEAALEKIIIERPDFPAMKKLKTGSVLEDEHYQMQPTPYSRSDVDVLARLDLRGLDQTLPGVHRTDGDFPVAWIKSYGKGRVFYSGLGHTDAAWDDPRVQTLFLEGIKWAINGGQAPRPHPMTPAPK